MAQLASYTRMIVTDAPKLLAAAIPIKRLFRRPAYRLEAFLLTQLEHVVIDQVDGDTIIGTGLAIELMNLCPIYKSSERDLDAIAASLSRHGGVYWFFTDRHRDYVDKISIGSIGQEGIDKLHSTQPDFSMIELGDIARALPIYQESVKCLQDNEVVLWSVG